MANAPLSGPEPRADIPLGELPAWASSEPDFRQHEIRKYYWVQRDKTYGMRPWRQRILRQWFEAGPRCSVLDVGCGKGESLRIGKSCRADVIGCDIVDYLCDGKSVHHIHGAHELPFTDGRFDFVLSVDVLEHIHERDSAAAVAEMFRVCRRGLFLGISHKSWKPELIGTPKVPFDLHITCKTPEWWLETIRSNCPGARVRPHPDLVAPAVKQPYSFVEVDRL